MMELKGLYSGRRWRTARLMYLREHPLCVICQREGRTAVAEVVDHITPHKGDVKLFWDRGNWQAVCKKHHDRKTAREDSPSSFKFQTIPYFIKQPPVIPLTLVCGPPGAGKSTYAEKVKGPRTLIIDLDYIIADLSGEPVHGADSEIWLGPGMVERNRRLSELSKPQARNYSNVIFITSAPSLSRRRDWVKILEPVEVVILETDKFTCISRIEKSQRRYKAQLCKAVNQWWKTYTAAASGERIIYSG